VPTVSNPIPEPQPGKFVQISVELLRRGCCVRFRVSGGSMRPAIRHGDVLTVAPVAPCDITPGAVAVYRRFDRLLAHRVVRVDADESGARVFVLRGDAASACDPPVAESQMLGAVLKTERRTSAIRSHAAMLRERLVRAGMSARR
jgi:signal peptidase I